MPTPSERPLRIPGGPRHQPYPHAELHPTDALGAFFLCGLTFLAGAALAGLIQTVVPWEHGRWLALHLAFLGGVSQLVLGAGQFFVGAFLAADPPSRRTVRAELGLWNSGVVLLAVAVPLGSEVLVWIAVAGLVLGLAVWIRGLLEMGRRSLNLKPWGVRWYPTAAGFLAAGIVIGGILATGTGWRHGYLTGAHMVLNLGGWFGATIVGTLHTFYPTLTRSRLRFPRSQVLTYWLWSGGVAVLAVSYSFGLGPSVTAGWLLLIASAALLGINLVACRMAARVTLSLPARLVGIAQPFLPLGLAVLAVATADGSVWSLSGPARTAAGSLLVLGWVGLTVLGSLLHLLVILIRARDHRRPVPAARPRRDSALAWGTAAGVAGVAAGQLTGADTVQTGFGLLLLAGYAILALRVAWLGTRVWRHARPGI